MTTVLLNAFRKPINRNKYTLYQRCTHLNLYDDTKTFPCRENWFKMHEENLTSSCGFQVYKGEFFWLYQKTTNVWSIFTNSIFAISDNSHCHKNVIFLQLLHFWNILLTESIILAFVYIYVFASWFCCSNSLRLDNLNIAIGIQKYQFIL